MSKRDSPWKRNPVFWIVWGLLATAVLASFVTLAVVLAHPDDELDVPQTNVMMR